MAAFMPFICIDTKGRQVQWRQVQLQWRQAGHAVLCCDEIMLLYSHSHAV